MTMPDSTTDIARTTAAPAASRWRPHIRALIALAIVVVGTAGYFGVGAVAAYTSDAYVRSDLVAVAPEVAGIVETVLVRNNQKIAAGDPIAVIDPQPYQLDVNLKRQQIASLEAAVAVRSEAQVSDAASRDAAAAALRLAQQQFGRVRALAGNQYMSQADLDKAADQLRAAHDLLAVRQAQSQVDDRQIAAARAQVMVARAELALAEYRLSRTRLSAPVGGYINNLTLRPGTYARVGEPLVGIVDGSRWRVVANFKEDVAAATTPGQRVWVWLSSDPWHVFPGHVQGTGRGIARQRVREGLLPYVAPTTDWIRLRRRLQVTILLDPPVPIRGLFMGADARVFFFR